MIYDYSKEKNSAYLGKQTRFGTKKPNPPLKIPEGPQKFYTNGGSTYQTQDLPSLIPLAEAKHKRNELKLKPGDERINPLATPASNYRPHNMDEQEKAENGKEGDYKGKREEITLSDFCDIIELLQQCISTEDKTEASIDQGLILA